MTNVETRYILKRFAQGNLCNFSEIVNVNFPVKRLTIEALAGGSEPIGFRYWNGNAVQEDANFPQANPLATNFCLLQTNITPETAQGCVAIGQDMEGLSHYEYIFSHKPTFNGAYNFSLVNPSTINMTQTALNQFTPLPAPVNNFYVSIKITFYSE